MEYNGTQPVPVGQPPRHADTLVWGPAGGGAHHSTTHQHTASGTCAQVPVKNLAQMDSGELRTSHPCRGNLLSVMCSSNFTCLAKMIGSHWAGVRKMMVLVDSPPAGTHPRYVSAATYRVHGILESFLMVSWPIRIMRSAVVVNCATQVPFGLTHQDPDET